MTPNEQLIQQFYKALQNKDYKAMQACYADNASFNDAVFKNLNAKQVRAMWEMFCLNGKGMTVEFSNISANETKGSAEWIASYIFSKTGNKVVNKISARFTFEDGKIVNHTDTFNFYKWAKQALGLGGLLLGWTPIVKAKVQKIGMKSLNEFMNSNKA